MKKVMVITDPGLTHSDAVKASLDSLRADGIDFFLYDRVRVEPTDGSLQEAIDCARGTISMASSPSAAAPVSIRRRRQISTPRIRGFSPTSTRP